MRLRSCRLTMTSLAVAATFLPACGKSQQIGVSTSPEALAAANKSSAAKDDPSCLDPGEVRAGKEYTCADGKKRNGKLVVRSFNAAVATCSRDNEKGCLTTEDFSAFAKVERAKLASGNVKQGVVIAEITGTLTSAGPADCVADGEVAAAAYDDR